MIAMKIMRITGTFFLALMVTLCQFASAAPAENPYKVERSWPDYFLEHQKLFTEQAGTYKAGKYPVWTVHVPGGWIGNSTIIEGDDGLIVYDTSVNAEAGAYIAAEIRKISDKPIKAIFYSHHHGDHYNGTSSLVTPQQVADGSVKIYAWDNFEKEIANEFGAIMPRQTMGILFYGPDMLQPEDKHYHGCCSPKLLGGKRAYIPPTDTFSEDTELEIAGIKIRVFYTGGEAISEFGLHIPEFDMVLIGDEFFYALANVHSIRGSKPRLPENYMKALDTVRAIQPEWLLGSHIMPMQGREEIQGAVTASRDAIQYLWDQSIRYINKGYTADELQHKFRELPAYLDKPPYTRPMYGTPWIIAPEIFSGWVSWFSGDAAELLPTEPVEKARRYVGLMGGRDKVLAEAEKAFTAGDAQFSAELTQMLVRIDHEDWDARYLKAASLRKLGYEEINTIARAWYLKGALELEGKINPAQILQARMGAVRSEMTGAQMLQSWRYQIDADKAADTRLSLGIHFTDSGEHYRVELRNSILEIRPEPSPEGMPAVSLTTDQLRSLVAGERTESSGNVAVLAELINYLDLEQKGFSMHVR
jgi:alkyl sulfatase BDS1-like metallo-beta-lactamase superfamily hydrolase